MLQNQALQEIVKDVVEKERQRLGYSLVDSVLIYLSQEYPGKTLDEIEDEEEESALETEVDDLVKVEAKEDHDLVSIRYLQLDENIMQPFAYNERDAHDGLYDSIAFRLEEEEYEAPTPVNDDSEAYESLTEEVHEDIKDLKYEFLDPVELDPRKVELLTLYIVVNHAEFAFYEYLLGFNRNSDY